MSFRWTSRSRRAGRAGTALATSSRQTKASRHQRLFQALESLEDRTLLSAGPSSKPTFVVYDQGSSPAQTASPNGFTPNQIRTAYGVSQISIGGVAGDGAGETIAIVDAFNQPNIVSDLHNFDQQFGLPDPPSFTVVNQTGQTSPLPMNAPAGTWGTEISLDVEWAHSMAPKANIILVEANSALDSDLDAVAVPTAADLPGVSVVSMSFGGPEFLGETSLDPLFTTPAGHSPVTFLASTGDSAAPGGYPAFSPNVVAVGGTSLFLNGDNTYNHETAWNLTGSGATQQGGGGGVSTQEPVPSYQTALGFSGRATPDISFDANPATGVAVYDSYDNGASTPWEQVGGTSLAAPAVAGLISIVDEARVAAGDGLLDGPSQTLPLLYALPASAPPTSRSATPRIPCRSRLRPGDGPWKSDCSPVCQRPRSAEGDRHGPADFGGGGRASARRCRGRDVLGFDGGLRGLFVHRVDQLGRWNVDLARNGRKSGRRHVQRDGLAHVQRGRVVHGHRLGDQPDRGFRAGECRHERGRRAAGAGRLHLADCTGAGGRPAVDGRGRLVHRHRRGRAPDGLHGVDQLGRQRDEPGNHHVRRQRRVQRDRYAHLYTQINNFFISTTVNDIGGSSVTFDNFSEVQDAPLTPLPRTFNAVAGTAFFTAIASFSDENPGALASDFSVSVDWGDGTPPVVLPAGSVVFTGTGFDVKAGHTYATFGTYTVAVSVTDVGTNFPILNGSTTTVDSTAIVADAPIVTSSSSPVTATEGLPFTALLGTFTSSNTLELVSNFQTTTIDWGDNTTSPGTIVSQGNGKFAVFGTHTYLNPGRDTFQFTINSTGTARPVTITGSANVVDATLSVTPMLDLLPPGQTSIISGQEVSGQVATFVSADPLAQIGSFTATVDWGDGSQPTLDAAITQPGGVGTPFVVSDSHTYAIGQNYTVTITVNDVGGSSDTESTTAVVTDPQFTVSGIAIPTINQGDLFSGSVAILNTGNPLALSSDFLTSINWGDGTFSQGLLTSEGTGIFVVFADCASSPYTAAGTYPVTTTVVNSGGNSLSTVSTITVNDAPITGLTSPPISVAAGTSFSGVVANFVQFAGTPADEFVATINWGDGTTPTIGQVSQVPAFGPGFGTGPVGSFLVSGTHLYTIPGSFTPQVTITDLAGTTATLFESAQVSDTPISATSGPISVVVGQPFSGPVATFTEPNTFAQQGEFIATINWGDGTPVTQGAVSGSNGTFTVTGTHTYATAGKALPVTVTITHVPGGVSAVSSANAHVLALLSGAMSSTSDTGTSNHDGITRVTNPIFAGKADPGSTITLFAAPVSNPAAKTRVGGIIAGATGNWAVQIGPLGAGSYVVTATMVDPSTGITAETTTLPASTTSVPLVIATSGPTVSSVTLDPKLDTLHVIFQMSAASMPLTSLMNGANYTFDAITTSGALAPFRPVGITAGLLPGSKVQVNVRYNGGSANGGYVVVLNAAALTDFAGNPLRESHFLTFPQTTNSPNPNYVAQINVSGGVASAPVIYVPLAEQKAAAGFAKGTQGKIVVRVPQVSVKPAFLRFM